MNSLIRPALYGAYHAIGNFSRLDEEPSQLAHIVGPICETGRRGHARHIAPTCEGDVLLIGNTGAYGPAMASHYNLRKPADQVMLAEWSGPGFGTVVERHGLHEPTARPG